MLARDVMTTPVITAGPNSTIGDIASLMLDKRISGVPIVDADGRLVGMVSEGDLMRRTEIGTERHRAWWMAAFIGKASLAKDFAKSHGMLAEEVMSRNVRTVRPDAPLWEIAEIMEGKKLKRLPVVEKGQIVGIVTRANLLQALTVQHGRMGDHASKNDQVIRKKIMSVLQQERWANTAYLNVVVRDGTVHFWGLVDSDEERAALKAAAEGIPHVTGVVDHTVFIAAV